ncbi:hypothetical protein HY375_00770 [Candidatus Berkelbacteria bacterium]|nr:hypothetical protein [Candidatus Berkelbacteria bacterium]
MDFPRLTGIVGLLLIVAGVLQRSPRVSNSLFAVGGVFLFAYSIAIRDVVFALLQLIFAGAAIVDLVRHRPAQSPPSAPPDPAP